MDRPGLSFALFFFLCAAVFAQTPTGEILGAVRDSAGLVVPGAKIVVTHDATGRRVETRSNGAGDYLALSLAPGAYTLTVEKEGFKQFVRQGIAVSSFENV